VLDSPNGGNTFYGTGGSSLTGGNAYTIWWYQGGAEVSSTNGIDLLSSLDGGANWSYIAAYLPSTANAWNSYQWTVPNSATSRLRVRLNAYDGSNNLVGADGSRVNNRIVADTTPPTGSVTINSGVATTKSSGVTLNISASDSQNTVTNMCVSNTGSCSAWENFASSKAWTLSAGDGVKYVYAWFRDKVGNTSGYTYDSIVLDTVPPAGGLFYANPANGYVATSWSGISDGTSGINHYDLLYSTAGYPATCTASTPVYTGTASSFNHSVGAGTHYYRLCAIDMAGNVSTGLVAYATLTNDLQVSSLGAVPSKAYINVPFVVSDNVLNVGNAPTPAASTNRYYLSADLVRGSDLLLSGSRVVPAGIPGGGTSSGSASLVAPSGFPLGTYYLMVCADDLNAVAESNESNNCRFSTTTVTVSSLPDLVVAAASAPPAEVAPGERLTLTDTTRNVGTISTGKLTVTRAYLSTDSVKSGEDLLLGTRSVAILLPGADNTGTLSAAVPLTAPLGNYYLLTCADAAGGVLETDETNNCAVRGPILVGKADLVEIGLSNPPAAASPGSRFTASDIVRNAGTVNTKVGSYTKYFLSSDVAVGGDLYLGLRAVPILAPGMDNAGTLTLTIPATTPEGSYFLMACADNTGRVAELNETNNCRFSGTTIGIGKPDLVISAFSNATSMVQPGGRAVLADTTRNQGSVASSVRTSTKFYLSADNAVGGDLYIGIRSVNPIPAGSDNSGTLSALIPATTPLGTYQVLACADNTGISAESNETNNCTFASEPIRVGRPDLVMTSISSPPPTAARGSRFSLTDITQNIGTASTSGTTYNKYFLSLDAARDISDIQIGLRAIVANFPPGGYNTLAVTVTVPTTVPSGTYNVIGCSDDANTQIELSEANNCRVAVTQVVVP
jgi:subtilase family serine protease